MELLFNVMKTSSLIMIAVYCNKIARHTQEMAVEMKKSKVQDSW